MRSSDAAYGVLSKKGWTSRSSMGVRCRAFSPSLCKLRIGSRIREALLRLADVVGETVPEEAVRARFGDDEICTILPGVSTEDAYRLAEEVLLRLAEDSQDLRADAGVAGYPEHGESADEVVAAAFKALKTAKRVGGSGIVVAR